MFENTKDFNYIKAILALIIVLGLIWGGYQAYQKLIIKGPLKENIMELSEVEEVQINKAETIIEVKMKKVNNFKEKYLNIEDILYQNKQENFKLQIKDKSNEKLNNYYQEIELIVYEAIAKNNYLWLEKLIKNKAQQYDLQIDIFLDENNLYLQAFDNENYLYKVFPRPKVTTPLE